MDDGPSEDPAQARSVDELITLKQAGVPLNLAMFWGHTPRHPDVLDASCLSQWWPAPFSTQDGEFASAEHYMMWRKARLFRDFDAADQIVATSSPRHAKELGRNVRGFDDETWRNHRWEVVVSASHAKFSSDPRLTHYLVHTGGHVLVEASPVDRVWGIGLSADSKAAEDPSQWRGLNLLGFALMEARQALIDSVED